MSQSGLLAWANSIRYTMACDHGRQLFADQIHTQGFIFLDSYLDNILGPKQELMIELVKTPGRKKVNKAKMTTITSKLRGVVLSLEDDDGEKENVDPVNNFHRALLQVRDKKYDDATQPVDIKDHKTSDTASEQPVAQLEEQKPLPILGKLHAPEIDLEEDASAPYLVMDLLQQPNDEDSEDVASLLPSRSEQNDLSVIAEDDESAERSRTSIHISPTPCAAPSALQTSLATDTSTTFQENQAGSVPQPMPKLHLENAAVIYSSNSPANANEALTDPLSTGAPVTSSLDAPTDSSVPVHCPVSPNELIRKGSVPLFPNLPVPLALRKSMRAPRDPSMGIGLGSATPAPVGKRSSWLIKAREANAMEQNGKRTSTLGTTGTGATVGMKRKSGDLFGDEVNGIMGDDVGNSKAAKLADGERFKAKDTGGSQERIQADISTGARLKQLHQRAPQLSIPTPPQSQYQEPMKVGRDIVTSEFNSQDGMLDRLKRTVEGLGARVGKSMGKSLGGVAAANALAEARAAAEARVAERERNKDEGVASIDGRNDVGHVVGLTSKPQGVRPTGEGRLSVSDLVAPHQGQEHSKVFQSPITDLIPPSNNATTSYGSTSTTPPHSPPTSRPASFAWPSGPVFNKPPPVFVPPPIAPVASQQARAATSGKALSSNLAAPTFSMPVPAPLGLGREIPPSSLSNSRPPASLSAQSTMESIASDRVFDAESAPAWMPTTQDTEYSFESQPLAQYQHVNDLDEDDSWPLDEKLSAGNVWPFGHPVKEDSLTWSTLPMESQRAESGAESGPVETNDREIESSQKGTNLVVPGAFDKDTGREYDEEYLGLDESEIEELAEAGKLTVSLVEPNADRMISRSQSQLSMTSSSSSNTGFLGQASKLVNSVLGTGKKGKVEVKSLQLAAVAAKKQQEEMDKKAVRLKEMENRRQAALQRKTEEEKSKAMDQERKMKEDGERRKREREEHTEKRPLKGTVKKEEDNTKKRKVFVEIEKKPEVKKPALKALKPNLSASTATKTANVPRPASALKNPVLPPALNSSTVYNTAQPSQPVTTSPKMADAKMTIVAAPSTAKPTAKGKGKATVKNPDDSHFDKQPSHLVQNQMAARVKAQIQAAKEPESEIASENIELPEIVSDFSDSEDGDQPRTFDPPDWAQSPELRQALQMQSTVNPDDIFGAIRPLRMEELFRTRTSRFRARTSSANWHGSDRLTAEEVREYTRRMGYQ